MQVKDTHLTNVQVGDVLAWHNRGDFLGNVISALQPSPGPNHTPGHYTDIVHVAFVRRVPNPNAEVVEVRPGIFALKHEENYSLYEDKKTAWHDVVSHQPRFYSTAGVKLEATNPCVQENVIDWADPHMLVWRVRDLTPKMVQMTMLFADDMLGYQYDKANFLTFGAIRRPNARICSELVAESVYQGSLSVTKEYGIALTPDIAGNKDTQKTPNDIGNSGFVYELKFQGARGN
jgi:hypothetical protein